LGSGGIVPRILKHGTRWRYVVTSRPSRLTPGVKIPNSHRLGGWVGPRTGLDAMWKRKNPTIAPARNWAPSAAKEISLTEPLVDYELCGGKRLWPTSRNYSVIFLEMLRIRSQGSSDSVVTVWTGLLWRILCFGVHPAAF